MLGEHTEEILSEFLELSPDACFELRKKGII
jgi:crotonobetainyl-CoA:carnitine CoA-transferase CaiB-like acyl-CoA transferase